MSSFLIVHELTFHFTWSKSFSKSTKGEVSSQVPFLVFFLQLTWSEYFISCISIRYEFNLHVMVFQVRCTWIILVRGCNFFWLVFLQKDESWFSIISLLSNLSFLMSKFVLATFSIISVVFIRNRFHEVLVKLYICTILFMLTCPGCEIISITSNIVILPFKNTWENHILKMEGPKYAGQRYPINNIGICTEELLTLVLYFMPDRHLWMNCSHLKNLVKQVLPSISHTKDNQRA